MSDPYSTDIRGSGGIDVEAEAGVFTEFIIILPRDIGMALDQKLG
jgi:hypothetical protein